ncbi:MAG TPA: HD domain-containing phosphohydrolase [Polyangiaceae bacterium]|jgi:HD-GYP domain-containing protein (c-di-GMP phosphodiesterase class II)
MLNATKSGQVRLAELVAALSLGIDLGFSQPMEHMLRQCLIALRLAERSGLDDQERAVVYYTALLTGVGCHSDAHEQAKWFGDDLSLKSGKFEHGFGLRGAASTLALLGSGKSPLHRLRVALGFMVSGHRELNGMIEAHAKLAQIFARQLGLPESVVDAVGSSYEQWNGRGWPGKLQGMHVPVASRLTQLAEYVEVAQRIGGSDAAKALARKQRGKQFDPALVDLLCKDANEIFMGLDAVSSWNAVINAEPALTVVLSESQCDASLLAIADFVDLKSPFTLGHSRAVSQVVAAAGSALGLPPSEVTMLRRAGLVLGLGRLGVSNSIWDKPGPLGAGERERVRMHPYLTERILHQSAALAPLGAIAVQFRERLDGSGYPRGVAGSAISLPARILGAADAYHAMREPRPYRAARSADDAAAILRGEVLSKRLDGTAVEAVLGAAGHQTRPRREGPAGLTTREVEVLQLLARGLSNKEIADRLLITAKTAGNHIEHIYSKINATNRASASLFAVQHGLLPELT